MTLTMLQHVNIMTDKLDQTVAFYEDILGFENGERPNFAFPGAWLYCGEEAVIHLIGVDEQEATGSGCIDHVAFAAEGFDRYAAFLDEKGYEHETRVVPGGRLRQIFVRDPNEVLIELNFRADE